MLFVCVFIKQNNMKTQLESVLCVAMPTRGLIGRPTNCCLNWDFMEWFDLPVPSQISALLERLVSSQICEPGLELWSEVYIHSIRDKWEGWKCSLWPVNKATLTNQGCDAGIIRQQHWCSSSFLFVSDLWLGDSRVVPAHPTIQPVSSLLRTTVCVYTSCFLVLMYSRLNWSSWNLQTFRNGSEETFPSCVNL